MITIDFLVTCDYVLFDKSNKLSIIGLFNRFKAKELPFAYPRFFVVMRLGGDAGKYSLQILIRNASGEPLKETPLDIEIREGIKLDIALDITNTVFTERGVHFVEISHNAQLLKKEPLEIIHNN